MGKRIDYFNQQIKPHLQKKLGIVNPMAVPKVDKVIVHIGLGEALENKKALQTAGEQLARITGQKPIITHARRSISTFKLVAGDTIGAKVTLRGERMYDFLQKLIAIVLPRMRDFRGVSDKHFDGRGNYTLGLREQIVFPEIEYSKIDKTRGLEITIVTKAKTNAHARALLEALGMPFKKI